MNFKTLKQTEELFETLCRIRAIQGGAQYVESLELAEKALSSEALINAADPMEATIHFLYAKAVAMDIVRWAVCLAIGKLNKDMPVVLKNAIAENPKGLASPKIAEVLKPV
jgi:hypothetical protein